MLVPEDHLIYKKVPKTLELIEPLYRDTGFVKFNSFITLYDSGNFSEIISNKSWSKNAYSKYVHKSDISTQRLKSGINYWKSNKHKKINEMMNDAHDNFNMAARIEFVSRDEVNKCYHLFSFYTDRKYESKAYHFYDFHRDKLLKFISYFKWKASSIIEELNRPENLIKIPSYSTKNVKNSFRDYSEELLFENPKTKISSRTFEVMLLYSQGYTTLQIADMLNKSRKTIETFISHLYQDNKFDSRDDMRKYIYANGYQNLYGFFFDSYFKDRPLNEPLASSGSSFSNH